MALSGIAEAVQEYRLALARLWVRAGVVAAGDAGAAAAGLAEAEETLGRLVERARQADEEHAAAVAEHTTLDELVGAAVADIEAHRPPLPPRRAQWTT